MDGPLPPRTCLRHLGPRSRHWRWRYPERPSPSQPARCCGSRPPDSGPRIRLRLRDSTCHGGITGPCPSSGCPCGPGHPVPDRHGPDHGLHLPSSVALPADAFFVYAGVISRGRRWRPPPMGVLPAPEGQVGCGTRPSTQRLLLFKGVEIPVRPTALASPRALGQPFEPVGAAPLQGLAHISRGLSVAHAELRPRFRHAGRGSRCFGVTKRRPMVPRLGPRVGVKQKDLRHRGVRQHVERGRAHRPGERAGCRPPRSVSCQ